MVKKHEELNILLSSSTLEQVEKFAYLENLITEDRKCEKDIIRRSGLASAMVGKLSRIWKSCNISIRTKVKVYEALVIPVLMYGSECWTLNKGDERKISAIDLGWLRKILEVSKFTDYAMSSFEVSLINKKH